MEKKLQIVCQHFFVLFLSPHDLSRHWWCGLARTFHIKNKDHPSTLNFDGKLLDSPWERGHSSFNRKWFYFFLCSVRVCGSWNEFWEPFEECFGDEHHCFVVNLELVKECASVFKQCFLVTAGYTADIVWGHTSDSMCIGYMTETDTRPKVEWRV